MMREIRTVGSWEKELPGHRDEKTFGVDIMRRGLGYIGVSIYCNSKYTLKISISHYMYISTLFPKKKTKQKFIVYSY